MTLSLNRKAALSLVALFVVMGLLIFAPAGDVRYWRGWAFLAVFVGASVLMTLDMAARDPALLARRMKGGPTAETSPTQRLIMLFTSAGFVALLVVPPFAYRHGWAPTSAAVAISGDVLVALGLYGSALVYRENSFAAATIGLADGQRVVSTGPYAIVRHPLYACALVYLVGMPLALGSWWGLAPLALTLPFLIWRLFDEERFLAATLDGYRAYMAAVRWRLAPGVF
ncbi:MAG: isoprenylcysteine carboxylmethyltransferase family protein [Roseiarcus sp.]